MSMELAGLHLLTFVHGQLGETGVQLLLTNSLTAIQLRRTAQDLALNPRTILSNPSLLFGLHLEQMRDGRLQSARTGRQTKP